jgi:hypothetical protein
MQLVVNKHSLRLAALFSSKAGPRTSGTDMHGTVVDGVLSSAGSAWPKLPAALTTTITARLAAAWPLAAGAVKDLDQRLAARKVPYRVGYITFNHYIGSSGGHGQELRIAFAPLPASGARSFWVLCEWGGPLHLEPVELAGLSEAEFGSILAGFPVKGVDLARLGRYYEYSRPAAVHAAWLAAMAEMPTITRLLRTLGLP